jgi:hypothetical protein
MSDQASEPVFIQYLCYISSAPGMWAQYEGYMEVYAPEDEEDSDIFARTMRQLARTSFPDRFSISS